MKPYDMEEEEKESKKWWGCIPLLKIWLNDFQINMLEWYFSIVEDNEFSSVLNDLIFSVDYLEFFKKSFIHSSECLKVVYADTTILRIYDLDPSKPNKNDISEEDHISGLGKEDYIRIYYDQVCCSNEREGGDPYHDRLNIYFSIFSCHACYAPWYGPHSC